MSFDGQLATVADYEHYAKQVTPPALFEYYYGEHGDPHWSTETSNRAGFHQLKLRPRVMIDVSNRNLKTNFVGVDIEMPIVVGPTGVVGDHDPQGEIGTVRAAGAAGTIMVLSGISTTPPHEVAEAATGPWFQQIWMLDNRPLVEWMVRQAAELGAAAIVLTVSNSGETNHTATMRYPGAQMKAPMPPASNLVRFEGEVPNMFEMSDTISRSVTWKDLDWLRSLTDLPLILKGVETGEDAALCVEHGLDGLVISNHGGRFLQGGRGTIEALPEIVEAVAGQIDIGIDGGIRQGQDVLKALALGAKAAWIGRAARWGATVDGEAGVTGVLDILRRELDGTMGLCGVADVNDVPLELVTRDAVPTMEA